MKWEAMGIVSPGHEQMVSEICIRGSADQGRTMLCRVSVVDVGQLWNLTLDSETKGPEDR